MNRVAASCALILAFGATSIEAAIPDFPGMPDAFTVVPDAAAIKRFEDWRAKQITFKTASQDEEFTIHLRWALEDRGRVEKNIIAAWRVINWKRATVFDFCHASPLGRGCAMKLAIEAAKANDNALAMRIAVSCQLHNPEAVQQYNKTGPDKIGDFLRRL